MLYFEKDALNNVNIAYIDPVCVIYKDFRKSLQFIMPLFIQ